MIIMSDSNKVPYQNEFHMPRSIIVILVIGIIFFTGLIGLFFYIVRGSDNIVGYLFIILIFGLPDLLCVFALLQTTKTKYIVDETSLVVKKISKSKQIYFSSISNIRKSSKKLQHRVEKILEISTIEGDKIKIDLDYIVDSNKLVKLLKEKIPENKWNKK